MWEAAKNIEKIIQPSASQLGRLIQLPKLKQSRAPRESPKRIRLSSRFVEPLVIYPGKLPHHEPYALHALILHQT